MVIFDFAGKLVEEKLVNLIYYTQEVCQDILNHEAATTKDTTKKNNLEEHEGTGLRN